MKIMKKIIFVVALLMICNIAFAQFADAGARHRLVAAEILAELRQGFHQNGGAESSESVKPDS